MSMALPWRMDDRGYLYHRDECVAVMAKSAAGEMAGKVVVEALNEKWAARSQTNPRFPHPCYGHMEYLAPTQSHDCMWESVPLWMIGVFFVAAGGLILCALGTGLFGVF